MTTADRVSSAAPSPQPINAAAGGSPMNPTITAQFIVVVKMHIQPKMKSDQAVMDVRALNIDGIFPPPINGV